MSEWIDREKAVFDFVNKEVSSIDYEMDYFDGCSLVLIGNYDLTYYHTVEILFEDVSYVQIPTRSFDGLEIRIATPSQRLQFQYLDSELDTDDIFFAISFPSYWTSQTHFIVAKNIKARKCNIGHYPHDGAQPCEEKWNRGRYQEFILH